ncbi:MAG: hypothetical protein H0T79_23405 [Deltaproteobacteria bacterium]|nr:hypothetical protein [Deltaproteobacteria bacterium]
MRLSRSFALLALLAVGACGDDPVKRLPDGPPPQDARIDAVPADAAAPLPSHELTGGAKAVKGKRFAADVQIGHAIGQAPSTGNGKRIEGNSAVKP